MKHLNHSIQNCKSFQNRLNHYREIATRTTQNEQIYAIYCRPEIAGDVIAGENLNTMERYVALKFDCVSFSCFRDIKNHFVTAADAAKEADIDDSIKRKRIRVSLKKHLHP